MMDGHAELTQRIIRLDAELGNHPITGGPSPELTHFIRVLAQITRAGRPTDVRAMPCLSPKDADTLLENSHRLARLLDIVPEVVAGPLRRDSQYWVGTGKPDFAPKAELTLSESHFRGVSDAVAIEVSAKPFGVGLFTSTGVLGTYGMWRIYLDLNQGSTLYPRPWYTWAIKPHRHAVVHELAAASHWVELVLSHPLRNGELLFPDWSSVARDYDAVHMTLRAIVATQGLYFPTEKGIVAAPYWDIESTLWLRWCFDSISLVEMVT